MIYNTVTKNGKIYLYIYRDIYSILVLYELKNYSNIQNINTNEWYIVQ